MQNQKKKQIPQTKIERSESYQYRGEPNCYPFFNMIRLTVKDSSNPALERIISYSK